MSEDFKAGFLKTLWILRDYLSVIVIGGGWVSFLYHRYLLSNKSGEPIRTRDIDLLVDIEVPIVGEKSVDQLLLEADFKPTFKMNLPLSIVSLPYSGHFLKWEMAAEMRDKPYEMPLIFLNQSQVWV